MAAAMVHRGPDEDGFWREPGIALANRRLSIVGLADGRQPAFNEDRSVVCVFNGELFDYRERKALLQSKQHVFATSCDTELIPHLWEEYRESMLAHLRGQFALACFDRRERRLVLARDRFGICPLYWSEQRTADGTWLVFASEIKAILASGMVPVAVDRRGIDQFFNFWSVPGVPTCFAGVHALLPGQYLDVRPGSAAPVVRKTYWEIDFPDEGDEEDARDPKPLVDRFEQVLLTAIERRLRADVPVVSYLSGGIDSSLVVAMASRLRAQPIPTFTIQIKAAGLDETNEAAQVARHVGSPQVVVPIGDHELVASYAELIRAAEAPVLDTSCAALLRLASSVRQHGYKVALTGEGSDEWLAGYVWYKTHRALGVLDRIPGVSLGMMARRLIARGAPVGAMQYIESVRDLLGDHTPFQDMYGAMSISRLRFFSREMLEEVGSRIAYRDLEPNLARMRRWSGLHRSVYWAGRIMLAGHLLGPKGDRVSMNSSVENRYPFLDEDVFSFLAGLHPRWKLRGFQDKYILRLVAERYLPREVAWRPKVMFRAPSSGFLGKSPPPFIDQLLSRSSLEKSGYFDVTAVQTWRRAAAEGRLGPRRRMAIEGGLLGVLATQLWHHTFIDNTLAELPSFELPPRKAAA